MLVSFLGAKWARTEAAECEILRLDIDIDVDMGMDIGVEIGIEIGIEIGNLLIFWNRAPKPL